MAPCGYTSGTFIGTCECLFSTWVKESQLGQADGGRSGAVTVFDEAGAITKKYLFTKAWPKSLEIVTTFDGDRPILSERLVLVCERLEPQ